MRVVLPGVFITLLLSIALARAGVPMRWDATGHLLVPAMVNGAGPYPFMLDTGADGSAVYHWFAIARGLPKGHREELSGAVGSETEITSSVASMTLDGRTIRHVDADTLPDRPDGAKIAGVAGVDLMIDRIAILDTGCGTAQLLPAGTNPNNVVGARATMINAGSIRGGKQLTLPVSINGVIGVATLDTGARTTMVSRSYARAAGLNPESPAFKDGPVVRGATNQTISSRIGPIGAIQFAGQSRNNVTARIVDLPFFADSGFPRGREMNLGLDLLHDTRLTVDYRQRRFWVAPSACKQ